MLASLLQPNTETPIMGAPADDTEVETPEVQQERALVKAWLDKIANARSRWEDDFKRMASDMEFATGLQWPGQTKMDDDRYINNITLRLVNQKVATLYAKNPTTEVVRRERMDFQVWDESVESLIEAITYATQIQSQGLPLPPELSMLFADYQQGKERRKLVDRVSRTLKILHQYAIDTQKPSFKEQIKQTVRRTVVCSVGFARPVFCGPANYVEISSQDYKNDVNARISRIRELTNRIEESGADDQSEHYATLRSLVNSVGMSQALNDETRPDERLEYDFPASNSILVDERCSSLRGFLGARWIAQEYILPLDEVNAIFGTKITLTPTGDEKSATEYVSESAKFDDKASLKTRLVRVYEIFDKPTKTRCFVCEGYKDFLEPPAPPEPSVSGFWHHFALIFNGIEIDPNGKGSIYPPSDVHLARHPQKEWNRTRQALRDHRNANAPRYLVRKGFLTDDDKRKIRDACPNEIIELEGVPPDQPIEKFVMPMEFAPLDPRLYDTAPLEQDFMLGVGAQQANLGPAQPNVTATVGSIAEQSRLDVTGSNVDDLDEFLSALAEASGEMMLQSFSRETVVRVVGEGAAWPESSSARQDFLNEVYLKTQASSSGRPNRAIDLQNFQQIAPMLLQAGANPIGLVEEGVRRLDDNLEVAKFFPLMPPAMAGGQSSEPNPKEGLQGGNGSANGSPVTNSLPNGSEAPPGPREAAPEGQAISRQ